MHDGSSAFRARYRPPGLPPRVTTLGIPVDVYGAREALFAQAMHARAAGQPFLTTFVNPASVIAARQAPQLPTLLGQFDAIAPDGIGMVIAMQRLHGRQLKQRPARISFDDTSLAPLVFRYAAQQGLPVVLCGGKPGVALVARDRLVAAYPGIQVIGVFDGFDNRETVIEQIIGLSPAIVIVGMGVLVQETMLLQLVQRGWTGVGFTCGGYLDQLASRGTRYYPAWVDRLNMRFAYRLAMEPRRLGHRYLIEYPQFGIALIRELMKRGT